MLTLDKYLCGGDIISFPQAEEKPVSLRFISSTVPNPSYPQWKDCVYVCVCVCVWNESYLLEKIEGKEGLPLRVCVCACTNVCLVCTDKPRTI